LAYKDVYLLLYYYYAFLVLTSQTKQKRFERGQKAVLKN